MACVSKVVVFLLFTTVHQLLADYELRVGVHSYVNPDHENAHGWCCDLGCGSCDNYFVFCLKLNLNSRTCDLGVAHTGEVGGDDLTFSPGEGSVIGRQPNPILFANSGRVPELVFLDIHIFDEDDGFPGSLDGDDYVDSIYIVGPPGVSSFPTEPQSFTGIFKRSKITLSFQVECAQNYFDSNCSTFCTPTESYSCDDDTGNRICMENYYGSDCQVFCQARDDELGHYTCDDQGNRMCRMNYDDPPDCLTYSAVVDVCDQLNMCHNGGTCMNDGGVSYQCLCQDGYTGPNCDVDIDDCASQPCQNLGECVDQVNGFMCLCMGALCENPGVEGTPVEDAETLTGSDGGSKAGIIGGIVAGVVVILLLVCLIIVIVTLLCKRRRKQYRPNEGLTERLVDQTEAESNPGVNPTYVPTAVGTHITPEADETGSLESTLRDFTNPLYNENGDDGGDIVEDSADSSTHKVYNPLYRTSQRGRTTPVYSTYAKVGDRHSEGMYDTIDHKTQLPTTSTLERHSEEFYDTVDNRERVVDIQAHSSTASTSGSGVYDYVRTGRYNTGYLQIPPDEDNVKS